MGGKDVWKALPMTCVIGLETAEGVWMGSDSFFGTDEVCDLIDHPKWFTKGTLTFGWAGDARPAQIVEHDLHYRGPRKGEKSLPYLVKVVTKSIHNGLRDAGCNLRHPGATDETGTSFLVVFRGKLYMIQGDYSIVRSPRGCAAIGVGSDIALGAVSALRGRLPPQEAVKEALTLAAEWCCQVEGPFHVSLLR